MISSIYRRGPSERRPVDEGRLSDAIRDLWHSRGDIHVRADELRTMPTVVRMALEGFAIGKWGRRKA